MSVVDDIISGKDFQTQQKKKKKSVTEQIIAPYTNLENNLRNSAKNQNQLKEQQAQEFFDYLGWNNKKKKRNLFNFNIDTSSGLSSGFDILDPFISLGSSTIDAGANFMSGVENIAVQTTNLLGEGIATVSDLTGNKEFAQNLRDTIGGKNEDYNKKLNDKLLFKKAADSFDDYSIFGETADEIFQGAGYYGGMVGLQGLGVPWQVTAATTSYGSALQKAYENDASSTEANLYALISAAGEVASEYISGGLKLPGTGKTMETFTGRLVDKVGNKGAKAALGFLTNTFGEGAEEVVSGWISSIGEGLTFGSEEDKNALENIWKSSTDYLKTEAGRDFIMGVAVTALTNGVNPQTYQAAREGRNMVTGYTQNEQRVIDAATQEAIQQQQEETGKKLTKKEIAQIEEQVKEDLSKGFIDTNTIEKTLGFDGQQRITEVENMLGRELTQEEKQKEYFDARNKFYEGLQNDSYLMESLSEEGKKSQKFEVNINDYQNEAQRNIVQKAIDSGVLNNTRATHDYVDFVSKMCADKGMDFDFTNNEKLKGTRFALEGKTINGFVEGNKITVNVDSNTSLYKTVGHEITHTLEGSDLYTELQSSLKSYLGEREWNNRINELKDLYKDVKDANVENELTADLIGETLFTDKKFINNLSTQNRNVFQKIYNEIKYMYKVATAGSKEKRQLEKVKKIFDEAYRTNKNVSEETKLSVSEGEQVAPFNNEKIQAQVKGELKEFDNYFDYAKEITNNKQELAKELLFKNYTFNFEIPTNNNETSFYHGTDAIYDYDSLKTMDFDAQTMDRNYGDYFYITTDKDFANIYGKQIAQFIIPNNKIMSLEQFRESGLTEEQAFKDYWALEMPDNEYIVKDINKVIDYSKQKTNDYINKQENTKYSLTKDNQGRNLTEEQQEYFKDSKVRDREGNLLTMYHGSQNDFSVFSKTFGGWYGDGYYFTDSKESGIDYAKGLKDNNGKLYETYLDIKNPYINPADTINEDGSVTFAPSFREQFENTFKDDLPDNWNELYRTEQDHLVQEILKKNGYDGINNGDVWVAFNSNQIKNVDNTNPTDNPDIRYSLSESGQTTDSNGKELSKGQLEYFKDSKMLNSNGNLEVVYHTTPAQFTIFDKNKIGENTEYDNTVFGFFITPTKDFSTRFGDINNENKKSNTMELYANIKKPITHPYNASYKYSGKELDNVVETYFKAINEKEGLEELKSYVRDGDYDNLYEAYMNAIVTDLGSPFEYASDEKKILQRKGYDAVEFVEGLENNTIEGSTSDKSVSSYAVFNSNQLKNTDNLNPTTNDDIRLSMSNNNDIAPYYPGQITGEDVRLQEEIAPTVENIEQQTTQDLDLPFDVTFDEVKEVLDLPKDVDRTEYLKVSDTNESTGQEYENQYSPFDKAKKDLAQKKLEKFIEKETYKAIDQATNVAARYGEFNKSQKKQIKADLNRFANMTAEQLTNANTYNEFKDIVSQYADREMDFVDEHLKEVKNDIRKRKFNVSDIKNQITDYADFRRQYFGRLNLTDTGSSIDSQYQELSQLYPEYFSPDVTTEADMLNTLAEFMDLDTTVTEKYRLSDTEINDIASKAFSTLVREAPTEQQIQEFEDEIDKRLERRRSEVRRQQLLDEMGLTVDDIAAGKDINAIGFQRTDPIRLNEKVFGWEVGNKINDATIRQTIHNTAEKMRWQNQERNEIKELGIKARSKESAAVQKYGEGEYVNDLGEVVKYGDRELAAEFPNVATQEKIKRASEVLRGKYDRYIDQINEVLTDLGYDAIPKRQNYFRHFMELNDKFSQWGTPFNRQTMQEQDLPTDINGLTDQFKPGKNYFASALQRKGIKTTYDAITGIDGYLESAGNLIFHTEDIQRYRALSKLIRETYGQQHGLDNIDIMTEAEKNQRIEDVYGNKLSKYAAWLDEQANALAGKKAGIDRAVERIFGRKVYTAANTLKTQVGSNMTGFNVRSAMTNFASVVQGMSKTNKISLLKGTISTINNMIHDDGMTQKSDFLTGRVGTTQLSQKAWQKIANAGQIFMSATDTFTSNQIWRSKYFENLSKGMTEEQAIRNADDFAARVMGNRVQGATAEIFNSKTLGFLTQFQLEVNNQWSNIAHDNKIDLKSGNKSGASVVFQLGQLAAFSYIFNGLMKGLTGSDVMFDPIDLLKQIFNPDDDDKEKSLEERARGVMGDIVNQLPMASIFTGGRIPIQEAFKGAETGFKYLTNQTNEYGQNYTAGDVFDDSLESLAYLFMPTGYGQLRKTYKGTIDLDYDVNLNPFEGAIGITKRPVRGSYTDTGNLRFTADNSTGGRIKSALFGQYANSEAQDYINSGYKTISKSKIEELQALEMSSSEYKRWQKDFNDAIATTVEIDGDKYAKYKDDYGNIYFYNKDTRTLLDSDYAESDIDVKTLEKVDKNELIFDYVNNYGFTDEQRQFLYDENFTNTTTDKYGYEKYTGKEVDKKGKTVTKNYYYDPDTDTLYDSKYKEVDSSKLDELTKVAPSKTIQDAEGFDSYEEFDYSYKNPEKYNFIRQTGTYERYKKDKAYKEAVDWSYNTPVNYTMSKAFDENIVAYKEYMDTLNDIKADKDKNGKSISGSRKKKVFNYINSLDLNTEQKAILARSQYSSYDDYGYEIVNYLNNQTNISLEDEYTILEKLGYKIDRNRGTVSW